MTGKGSAQHRAPTDSCWWSARRRSLSPGLQRGVGVALALAALVLGWYGAWPPHCHYAESFSPSAGPELGKPQAIVRAASNVDLGRAARNASSLRSASQDPVLSGLAAATELGDLEARDLAVRELAAATRLEEAYHALGLLVSAPPTAPAREFATLLLRRLAEHDVAALERWARSLPDNAMRTAAFAALALRRCAVDASAALAWARQLGSSPAETTAALEVATELAPAQPADALDLAARQPSSLQRNRCLAHCVAQWAVIEPGEAAAWAVAVEDDGLREQLLARLITALAAEDPRTAANWAASALAAGPAQAGTAVAVAQRWAQRDLAAARAWAEAFPDERLRQATLAAVEQATSGQPPDRVPSED